MRRSTQLMRCSWRKCAAIVLATGILLTAGSGVALAKKHKNQNSAATQPAPQTTDQDQSQSPAADQTQQPDALAQAEANLNAVVRRLTAAFESSDKFKSALSDLDQAQNDYDESVRPVVAALAKNADYQTATQQSDDAEKAIAAARQSPDTSPDSMSQLIQQAMQARMAAAKIKNDALAADPTVQSSKAKLTTAGAALRDLRQQFLTSMKSDPDYVAALQAVNQAKANAANNSSQHFAAVTTGKQTASDENP